MLQVNTESQFPDRASIRTMCHISYPRWAERDRIEGLKVPFSPLNSVLQLCGLCIYCLWALQIRRELLVGRHLKWEIVRMKTLKSTHESTQPKYFQKHRPLATAFLPKLNLQLKSLKVTILIFLSKTPCKTLWCPGWSKEWKCPSHSLDGRIFCLLIFPCIK